MFVVYKSLDEGRGLELELDRGSGLFRFRTRAQQAVCMSMWCVEDGNKYAHTTGDLPSPVRLRIDIIGTSLPTQVAGCMQVPLMCGCSVAIHTVGRGPTHPSLGLASGWVVGLELGPHASPWGTVEVASRTRCQTRTRWRCRCGGGAVPQPCGRRERSRKFR